MNVATNPSVQHMQLNTQQILHGVPIIRSNLENHEQDNYKDQENCRDYNQNEGEDHDQVKNEDQDLDKDQILDQDKDKTQN